jgi:hypothetical protein
MMTLGYLLLGPINEFFYHENVRKHRKMEKTRAVKEISIFLYCIEKYRKSDRTGAGAS